MIPVTIKKQLLYALAPGNERYAEHVAEYYNWGALTDVTLFGETIMNANPSRAVAIVEQPLWAAVCQMRWVQPYRGAAVPVWVATMSPTLLPVHLEALQGRDCYFYPTARQVAQWKTITTHYRGILGRCLVDDGLFQVHDLAPHVVGPDYSPMQVALCPINVAAHFYEGRLLEFLASIAH